MRWALRRRAWAGRLRGRRTRRRRRRRRAHWLSTRLRPLLRTRGGQRGCGRRRRGAHGLLTKLTRLGPWLRSRGRRRQLDLELLRQRLLELSGRFVGGLDIGGTPAPHTRTSGSSARSIAGRRRRGRIDRGASGGATAASGGRRSRLLGTSALL